MKNRRIILDTNLWISFLITEEFTELDELIENNKITLIFSDELISEFIEVVNRPKFKKHFSDTILKKILSYFDDYGELVQIVSNKKICRDQKDDFLLNLSIDSKADYLITGDTDLLILEKIENTKIKTFKSFINHINH